MNLKRTRVRSGSVALAAALCMAAVQAEAGKFQAAPKNGIPDVYIVTLAGGVAKKPGAAVKGLPEVAQVAKALGRAHGGEVQETFQHALQAFVVRMPEARARKLAKDPRVASVEQDWSISAAIGDCYEGTPWQDTRALPSGTVSPQTITCADPDPSIDTGTGTPLCRDNWGLDRTDQISDDGKYYFNKNGSGVHVYVLDTGIRWAHREFLNADGTATRVSGGANARTDPAELGNSVNTDDEYGHGTHVAGIIGGRTFGVAKDVWLHPVRFRGAPGAEASMARYLNTVRGVEWIVEDVEGDTGAEDDKRPAVVNWSGGNLTSWINGITLNTAVSGLLNANIILVQAAGNGERDFNGTAMSGDVGNTSFGDTFPEVIVVGGMDDDFERWTTPCGTVDSDCGSMTGSAIDIWAPAEWVASSNRTGDDKVCTLSGTSMATPHVTGAVAAYLQNNLAATAAEVALALRGNGHWSLLTDDTTAKTIGDQSDNVVLRLNTITMPADTAPVAKFTVNCPGRQCSFDAAESSDDAGIVSHEWRFGDGTTGTGSTIRHTYPAGFGAAPNLRYALLKITDAGGKTDHLRAKIVVNSDAPPDATFTKSCTGLTCTFVSTGSSDDAGIASRSWNFGDSNSGLGETVTHTYATSGTYAVVLTVTDTVGQTDTDTQSVTPALSLAPPANTTATGSGATVTIQWTPVSDATGYDLERKIASSPWSWVKNVAGGTASSTTDLPSTSTGVVLYRVVARAGSNSSLPGNADVAWVGAFTDDPIASPPPYMSVKADHIIEMRHAVNALRSLGGAGNIYTGTQLDANALRAQLIADDHWGTLMDDLNAARAGVSLPPVPWTGSIPDENIVSHRTHIQDLRAGVK